MATSELFHPAALGAGVTKAEIEGAVLSMFSVTLVLAVLPALSTACPEMVWWAPSVLSVAGGGQLAIPEVASLHVKVTVTVVLFHPAALAAGLASAVITGGSL
jgi:hypothetical protein